MHGSPSRVVNSIGEHNGGLFGLCCPTRRTNRLALVRVLTKKHFCSAIRWFSSCNDDRGHRRRGGGSGSRPPVPHVDRRWSPCPLWRRFETASARQDRRRLVGGGLKPNVAARGKPTDRRTEMFAWQQAYDSRSVGPFGQTTEPAQTAIVFANTVDHSRGGTMHVLGPHQGNVPDPVPNEEPREVASLCILKNPTVDKCMLASSNISTSSVEASQRCWTSGIMQSPCHRGRLPSTSRSTPPTPRPPSSPMSSLPSRCYRQLSCNTLPLCRPTPRRHHSVSSHCGSLPFPRLPTRPVDASPP